jgi:hypothetical protein
MRDSSRCQGDRRFASKVSNSTVTLLSNKANYKKNEADRECDAKN